MTKIRALATTFAISVAAVAASAGPAAAAGAQTLTVPDGISAGIMVYDRNTNSVELQYNAHQQFRSASVVKLMIALDYLETNGTNVPEVDLVQLQPMLRSSDDDAASYLWVKDGWETIVQRVVAKVGLTDSAPPVNRGMWGYTAISAADVVKLYDYILTKADPAVRDFIMSNLHQSTKCGDDGFDQSFGIQSAVNRPWAVKQGWSGFGDTPDPVCSPANPVPPPPGTLPGQPQTQARTQQFNPAVVGSGERTLATTTDPGGLDLTRRAMHTTGTVGPCDDKIMVVLTLEPVGTTWKDSADRITALTSVVYHLSQWP
ncbi:hypothetical protein [Kutzneria chonburiensis]|uniref:Uncharacterized protein n=1 Tax=Kutzneria chonburiensis TaxID=1483604 RepID=A0ABV6MS74_9PSEU|nr:hypothetical protein [Kutzneria chonburiensis]